VVLNHIPFTPDITALRKYLHIREGSAEINQLEVMVKQAQAVANPKAIFKVTSVEKKEGDVVLLDNTLFKSRVLSINLTGIHRVFAFVATCGEELESWAKSFVDPFDQFWADAIMISALTSASDALTSHLIDRYQTGNMATMNPGSLEDWPITEQTALFSLLGNVTDLIGVRLTESLLMVPTKSVSGLFFQTASDYENCQLCPRENCPNRRAVYDPNLYSERYSQV
jgi:hypothetical protein